MKKIKLTPVFFVLALLILLTSCKQKEIVEKRVNKPLIKKNTQLTEFCIYEGETQYAVFGVASDYHSFIIESKDNPLSSGNLFVADNEPPFGIKANGINLNSGTYSYSNVNQFYGQEVNFEIGEESEPFSMYIPEIINITSPPVTQVSDLYPFCYFEDFLLTWNADPNNTNGIVVVVEWTGAMHSAPRVDDVYIRNIDILPEDDGGEVLNELLFANIPEDAIATLTITRGNVDIVNIENIGINALVEEVEPPPPPPPSPTIVKIGGETIASLPFVLVRDMSHYI